jgi:Arc/MetJ-type ribon-helix-helix transcriptional regulator
MAATRTQIYLTAEQRERIEALRQRDGRSLAEVVRAALDRYLDDEAPPTPEEARRILDATFGAAPDFEVPPREEWNSRPGA